MTHVLIVGDGPEAHHLAERLSHRHHAGTVTILGSGAAQRPFLPPSTVASVSTPHLLSRPPSGARVLGGVTVHAIDREHRRVRASVDGVAADHSYDVLVLATGARPVVPRVPGLTGPDGRPVQGVCTPSTAADYDEIAVGDVVVLGGGAREVETAGALAARGAHTTLVCPAPYPLDGRLDAIGGRMLTERLEPAGVTVIGGNTVVHRAPGRVVLTDGTSLRADTVVVCASPVPETGLARAAGLDVRDGILVDDRLRTSDPYVHALGDCTEHDGRTMAGANAAWDQGEILAEVLVGRAAAHRSVAPVLRLSTAVADVACIGSLDDFERHGTRSISLIDPVGHRYARLALHDERIVAAVLFGLPQAIATIAFLHRSGRPLPSDRLGLLLDLPPRPRAADSTEASEDALVCLCNSVSQGALSRAWRAGARTVTALAAATRATTGCGGCGGAVRELCHSWASETGPELEKAS
ncbi:FAD-dependent oxidoreductase [Streptomyces sp. NPDC029216]|uniref:NAD(P)/FAD-dependent oxidoreductase n=1 Tax=Streptomyces sp. NPDC029216 TaxID=3154701 RepID=UPI00340D574D